MGGVFVEVGGDVDNLDGRERAAVDADTTPDTHYFTQQGLFGRFGHCDAFFARPVDRTLLATL